MVSRRLIGRGDGFGVVDVRYRGGRGWSEVERANGYTLVLVRRGCFRRRTRVGTGLLDAGTAYFEQPEQEQLISHSPHCDGDACTAVAVDEMFLAAPPPQGIVFGVPSIDALHRRLLAEPSLDTVVALIDAVTGAANPRGSHRLLVDGARELLAERPASTLTEAARALAVSAPHLSRVFRVETDETFSRYRNRVRVHLALERIRDGERSLARLAADLGFADHAHLARTVKQETGMAPRAAATTPSGSSSARTTSGGSRRASRPPGGARSG